LTIYLSDSQSYCRWISSIWIASTRQLSESVYTDLVVGVCRYGKSKREIKGRKESIS
jgi:hypothetical protein